MNEPTDSRMPIQTTRPHPKRDALAIVMWISALSAVLLLCWEGSRRWRSVADPRVRWTTSPSDARAAGPAPTVPHMDNRQDVARELADGDAAMLAALGSQLDRPDFGDSHCVIAATPADGTIPIPKRWQIAFAPGVTEGQYARQLATLGIEVGVLTEDGNLEYVTKLGDAAAERRRGKLRDDERPYWTWDRGDLKRADVVLLRNAGVNADNNIVLHFLSPSAIEQLSQLEQDYQGRSPEDILLTRFELKRTFRGYEVFVVEQRARSED